MYCSSGGEDENEVGLAAELSTITDDVVGGEQTEEEDTTVENGMATSLALPAMRSQAVNRVFIERKSE